MTDFQAPAEQTWRDRPEWHEYAACAGMPQDHMFFLPDRDFDTAQQFRHIRNAERNLPGLKVCQGCLVRKQCLEEALSDPRLDVGIRGGMTSLERRQIRRKRKKLPALRIV